MPNNHTTFAAEFESQPGAGLINLLFNPLARRELKQCRTIMTNYAVIDQFFAAQVACNESEETLKALRPQVEEAVQALIAERGLGKSFTGTIEYHGIKIVVSRPKSYTWEKNTNPTVTSDPNHAIYVQQLALQEQIAAQLKDMRADVKRTAEKLAKAHPDSESIKHSFRIAFGKEKESR